MKRYRRFPAVPAQHHAENQIVDSIQGVLGAVDLNFFHNFPSKEGGHQPAQPQNMIKMSVG